jgi:hypothetical protein
LLTGQSVDLDASAFSSFRPTVRFLYGTGEQLKLDNVMRKYRHPSEVHHSIDVLIAELCLNVVVDRESGGIVVP